MIKTRYLRIQASFKYCIKNKKFHHRKANLIISERFSGTQEKKMQGTGIDVLMEGKFLSTPVILNNLR